MIPSIEQEIRDLHELLGSSRDPEGRAFVPLADAYRRSGDPARALELLRRGTERHPSLASGHLVMAWTFRDLADDEGAESAFREVLALDGDNARALVGLGRLVEDRDDVGEAERLVQRGLALDPRLASEGTPDRVPRHSTNPEVVGSEALAPLEWEVIEPEATAASDEVATSPVAAEVEPESEPDHEPALPDEPASVGEPELDEPALDEPAPSDGAAPGSGPDLDEHPDVVIMDAADLAPDPVDDEADIVPLEQAEEALLASLEPDPTLPATEWSSEGIDIEWEVEGFYQPIPESAPAEPLADEASAVEPGAEGTMEVEPLSEARLDVEPVAEAREDGSGAVADESASPESVVEAAGAASDTAEDGAGDDVDRFIEALSAAQPEDETASAVDPVLDPWTLAPDETAPRVDPEASADAAVDLAALAPDDPVEAASESSDAVDATDDDLALPTRTLGDLYARQGLTAEAIKVYEELVARDPTNAVLGERLEALREEWSGGGRPASRATPTQDLPTIELSDDDEPAVLGFFDDLLGWEPGGSGRGGA